MKAEKRTTLALGLIALIGACAAILMFWVTDNGPGISPDSVAYMETAQNLLTGRGFFALGEPMTRYAPGYPVILAGMGFLLRRDVLLGGRLLCTVLFGINVALFGLTVFICTKRSLSAAAIGMGFILASAPILSIHSMAWSEVPFITLTLAGFLLLAEYLTRSRSYLLLAAALCAGCAMATRYIGVTLLLPMLMALFFFGNRHWKLKILDSLLVVALASLPLAVWVIRNLIIAGSATSRSFVLHRIGLYHARQFLTTMVNFVFPVARNVWLAGLQMKVALAVLLVPVGAFGVLFLLTIGLLYQKKSLKNYPKTASGSLTTLWFLFFLTYLLVLAVSESTFDASTPLDERILLPAFLAILISGMALIRSLSGLVEKQVVWYGFLLVMLIPIFINGVEAVTTLQAIHKNGSGYTAVEWKDSPTLGLLRTLPKEIKIYSNGYDAIPFLTGRSVSVLPAVVDLEKATENLDFQKQLQSICQEVGDGKAIVVYLNSIGWRGFLPSLEVLDEQCSMPVLGRFEDGVIYGR